jgi:Asp-tRNA(Asn)/Glu-tRNA(Gln) amidotransferase A subunit family amidase
VWTKAQKILVDAGAEVEELDLGKEFDGWMDPFNGRYVRLSKAKGGISIHRELTVGKDQVGETLAGAVENDVTPQELNEIRDQLAALRPWFDAIARGYDGIFVPSAPCEAPKWDGVSWIYFASLWTGLHVPTVHIPGFSGEGWMPMGLSLLSAR